MIAWYYNVKAYLDNKFFVKPHILKCPKHLVKPGAWCDLDYRLLYCSFEGLKNFVEKEVGGRDILVDQIDEVCDYKVIIELYDWWLVRRNIKNDSYDELLDYEDDTKKLKELISVRRCLWT